MKNSFSSSLVTACAIFTALTGAAPVAAPDDTAAAAARCCDALKLAFKDSLYTPNTPEYNQSISSYWALQSRISPSCIVSPVSAKEVSDATKTLVSNSCPFAIRSGGHNPFPNNNIQTGVTIDLSRLSQVTVGKSVLEANGEIAAIGPGARWKNVYDTLTPLGLAVPGGRAASVGVGGLTLGGGNSFFAAKYGFVCDNVENFEVVLANGDIVNANKNENSDLWTVLKGGSNNFGIVTRIDLTAFKLPTGNIWGGVILYPDVTIPDQIKAFVEFNNKIENYTSASLITFWAYSSLAKVTVVQNCYEYTEPVEQLAPGAAPAPIFDDLLAIQPQIPPSPQLPTTNTIRSASLSSLTDELEAAFDLRDLFSTLTFANDAKLIADVYDISQKILNDPQENIKETNGLNWVTMFQPLPTVFSKHSVERGGNVLGLDRATENQVLFLFFIQWADVADDVKLNRAADKLLAQVKDLAKSRNQYNEYIYLNYATERQDVLSGYGGDNVEKLKAAAAKYDKDGVFQKLVPGGFKVSNIGAGATAGNNGPGISGQGSGRGTTGGEAPNVKLPNEPTR